MFINQRLQRGSGTLTLNMSGYFGFEPVQRVLFDQIQPELLIYICSTCLYNMYIYICILYPLDYILYKYIYIYYVYLYLQK